MKKMSAKKYDRSFFLNYISIFQKESKNPKHGNLILIMTSLRKKLFLILHGMKLLPEIITSIMEC